MARGMQACDTAPLDVAGLLSIPAGQPAAEMCEDVIVRQSNKTCRRIAGAALSDRGCSPNETGVVLSVLAHQLLIRLGNQVMIPGKIMQRMRPNNINPTNGSADL